MGPSDLSLGARHLSIVSLLLLVSSTPPVVSAADASRPAAFNGDRAFDDLKRLVAFGPRPAGSKALGEAREWIVSELEKSGWQVERDSFVGRTPAGDVPMTNLIARLPGRSPQVLMLAGHYDTKRFGGFRFLGANDGGSSAAFLLEMARVLPARKNALTVWLVFFDGEEAVGEWSATDSLYGSRHLVEKLAANGELARLKAMILVDMIADPKLRIERDQNSTQALNDLVAKTAGRLGYGKYFSPTDTVIYDDHLPFVNAGVAAVDLIDLDYGPNRSYWHTTNDTLEHCSPLSLAVVGRVVMGMMEEFEKAPASR